MVVLQGLNVLVSIGTLICFILVVIKMFQHGQTGLGIASIVLVFCCGIGGLIAFIYGWVKSREWGIQNIMIAWTVLFVVGIILGIIAPLPLPVDLSQFKQ